MLKSPSRTTGPEAMPAAELPRDWLGFGFISVTSAKFRILVETTELLYIPLSLVTRQAPPKGVHGQVIHYPRENEFAGIHAQGRRDDGQEQKRRRHGRGDGPRGDLDEPPYLATSGSIIYKMMMEEWGREVYQRCKMSSLERIRGKATLNGRLSLSPKLSEYRWGRIHA